MADSPELWRSVHSSYNVACVTASEKTSSAVEHRAKLHFMHVYKVLNSCAHPFICASLEIMFHLLHIGHATSWTDRAHSQDVAAWRFKACRGAGQNLAERHLHLQTAEVEERSSPGSTGQNQHFQFFTSQHPPKGHLSDWIKGTFQMIRWHKQSLT